MASRSVRKTPPDPAVDRPAAAAARTGAIDPEMVAACYRVLLGREPETAAVINPKLGLGGYDAVLIDFVRSSEFGRRTTEFFRNQYGAPLDGVDVQVSPDQLARMFERIRAEWARLGDVDPYWSVLTDDAFRGARLDEDLRDQFYASGAEVAALIDTVAARCGVDIDREGVCLEFGCGVGRVTLHLARRFRRVVAVDISAGNLALCREMLAARGVDNVEVVQIGSPEDVRALPHFDFLASTIVLQHNPPPVQHFLLDILLKKISAFGGFLVQLPTHTPGYAFRADDYLASAVEEMELHSLPMADVFRLLAKHRLQPLEVLMDGWTGVYGSHTFFGVKRP